MPIDKIICFKCLAFNVYTNVLLILIVTRELFLSFNGNLSNECTVNCSI